MKEKVVYDNGSSKVTVSINGDIVEILQEIPDLGENMINLYVDEFEEVIKFVRENAE